MKNRNARSTHRSLIVLATVAAVCAGAGCTVGTELHWVDTADGVPIALTRYRLPLPGQHDLGPVILLRGATESRFAFDLDRRHSLARHLARDGFDVWTVEFRGHGLSGAPEGTWPALGAWSVDDYIHYDAVASFDYVNATTGEDILALGYSEGALILSAYLETEDPGIVKGMVGLAPGIVLGATDEEPFYEFPPFQYCLNAIAPLAQILPDDLLIPLHGPASLVWAGLILFDLDEEINDWALMNVLWNPDNMNDRLINEAMFKIPWMITSNEIKQYTAGMGLYDRQGTGTFPGSDWELEHGPFNYAQNLDLIDVPALVIAGAEDRFVPPVNARYLYDNISSEDKTFRVFSVDNGDSFDYGHLDLSVGVNAPKEVYPEISQWFAEHAAR